MSDLHITQAFLEAVLRGEVPPRVLATLGWQHLMALCPHCRAEVERWRQKRDAAASYDSSFRVLPFLLGRQVREGEAKGQMAERDLRDLLKISHEARLTRIQRAHTRFRGATLAGLLLGEAKRYIPAAPLTTYELAEAAQAVLLRTPAGPGVADLSARAAAYMGNSLRARGDLAGAEERLVFARHFIRHEGATDALVYAEIDWIEGTLRKDQRRFSEAEELLTRAATLYRLAGDGGTAAYPLVTLGLLHYDRQDYHKALETFEAALLIIQPERDPRLYCYARHNLILTLCELGDYRAAASALDTDRDLYKQYPDLYTQSRLAWIEGKIAAGFEQFAAAERAFLSIRDGFVREANGYDSAMVSLDLALIYAKQGRTAELRRLAEEMHPILAAQDIHREALAALLLFQSAARQEQITVELVEDLAAYLKRARTNPALRFRRKLVEHEES